MTVRPHRPGDLAQALGNAFERERYLERTSSGLWVYVGSGVPLPDGADLDGMLNAPPFQNSWANSGGGLQQMRFRWIVGGGIDLQGSVTGGALGTVIFTLPNSPLYRPDDDEVRPLASDDAGNLVVVRILTNGQVIGGL